MPLARRSDIRRHQILPYYIYKKYLADGTLAAPVCKNGRHPFHLWRHVEEAIEKLNALPATNQPLGKWARTIRIINESRLQKDKNKRQKMLLDNH